MLLIECPWCGPRAETEFSYGGEAGIVRPADPDALSDAEWADYLFFRANPRGAHRELWNHSAGCRRWFGIERDTVTYRIERSFRLNPVDAGPNFGTVTVTDTKSEPASDRASGGTSQPPDRSGIEGRTGSGTRRGE